MEYETDVIERDDDYLQSRRGAKRGNDVDTDASRDCGNDAPSKLSLKHVIDQAVNDTAVRYMTKLASLIAAWSVAVFASILFGGAAVGAASFVPFFAVASAIAFRLYSEERSKVWWHAGPCTVETENIVGLYLSGDAKISHARILEVMQMKRVDFLLLPSTL